MTYANLSRFLDRQAATPDDTLVTIMGVYATSDDSIMAAVIDSLGHITMIPLVDLRLILPEPEPEPVQTSKRRHRHHDLADLDV